jgi:DNA-binding transcriptional MerR regulator
MTSGQLAALLGVSDQTIRAWTETFAEHLSDSAKDRPMLGSRKAPLYFTPDDQETMATAAALRQKKKSFDEINAALKRGEREPFPESDDHEPQPGTALTMLPPAALMRELVEHKERLAHYEGRLLELEGQRARQLTDQKRLDEVSGQLKEVREDRNRLLGEVEALREARLEAEKHAARLEGRLEGLEAQQGREAPQSSTEPPTVAQPARRSWWKRLIGGEENPKP